MSGFSSGSWATTTTPSLVMPTSSSNAATPRFAAAARKPSSVFSGNSARAPRCPWMSTARAIGHALLALLPTISGGQRMQYTTLGRTGLKVSVAGLGCGGFSRLGLGTGQSADHAVGIVRQALDLGVNLIDTAAVYGTEDVVGAALRGVPRDSVVVCTKASKPAGRSGLQRRQGGRKPGGFAEAAAAGPCRRVPAPRRAAGRLRPCSQRRGPCPAEATRRGQIPLSGHHRDGAERSRTDHAEPRRRRTIAGTPRWWRFT